MWIVKSLLIKVDKKWTNNKDFNPLIELCSKNRPSIIKIPQSDCQLIELPRNEGDGYIFFVFSSG